MNNLVHHAQTSVENKRQLCFTLIALFSGNPKTLSKLFSVNQDTLRLLVQSALTNGGCAPDSHSATDFPVQCTTHEILYRLLLIAKAADNTALVSLIQKNTQIDVRLLLPLNPSSPPSSKPTSSRAPEPL